MHSGTPKKLSQETGGLNFSSLLCEELSQELKKTFNFLKPSKYLAKAKNN
jgi:hypothetical protein